MLIRTMMSRTAELVEPSSIRVRKTRMRSLETSVDFSGHRSTKRQRSALQHGGSSDAICTQVSCSAAAFILNETTLRTAKKREEIAEGVMMSANHICRTARCAATSRNES